MGKESERLRERSERMYGRTEERAQRCDTLRSSAAAPPEGRVNNQSQTQNPDYSRNTNRAMRCLCWHVAAVLKTGAPNERGERKQLQVVSKEGLVDCRWCWMDLCQLVLIVIYSEKAQTGLKAGRNAALTWIDFQQQLVIRTQGDHVSWEVEAERMRVQTASHEHDTDLWSGAAAVCTERPLWLFPQWRRTGQRQHGPHVRPRAHWQLLAWLWCTISVQQTAFSLSPPPS